MARPAPLLLHLPRRELLGARWGVVRWSPARLLRRRTGGGRRLRSSQVASFRTHPHEQAWAEALLARRSNLWLFRSNQHAFCGDFLVVDMSSPARESRRVWVVELKRGQGLNLQGGGAGVQFQNAAAALAELRAVWGIVDEAPQALRLCGDAAELQAYFASDYNFSTRPRVRRKKSTHTNQ